LTFWSARFAASRARLGEAGERIAGLEWRRRLDTQPHLLPGCQCLVCHRRLSFLYNT
jgi:hypothetical protein